MKILIFFIFFLNLLTTNKAMASYTASGQFCQLQQSSKTPQILATCDATAGKTSLTITLIGERPNKVREVHFTNADTDQLIQKLKLTASPLIDPETIAIMFIDFNFDGHKDFAIMSRLELSDNVKYQYFLFAPRKHLFQASPAMAAILSPDVFPSQKHIRSYWRKSPTVSGWDFWQWKNNQPFLAKRIRQITKENAPCQQTTIRFFKKNRQISASQKCP